MDSTGSITSVQTALDKLAAQRDELGELWATRKLRLDLCLQLRIFERDALEVVYYGSYLILICMYQYFG